MSEEVWTIGRLLNWTKDYLAKRGVASPRLDAEVLLAEAVGCARIGLYTRFEEVPAEDVRTRFKEMLRRRAEGEPVAYLVGKKEFYSEEFEVTSAVLIPRPETEFLVVGLLDAAKTLSAGAAGAYRLCDLGTGSGILAIIAAMNLKNSTVDAVDISPEALEVAAKNVRKHEAKIGERVRLLQGDLFGPLAGNEGAYDFVLTNPPYVAETETCRELAEDVYRYEPRVALFGGREGTEIIARILEGSRTFLKPGGFLLLELSPMIHARTVEMVAQTPGLEYVRTIFDLEKRERILVARRTVI